MKSDTWNDTILAGHREYLRDKSRKEAFDALVRAAIDSPDYAVGPASLFETARAIIQSSLPSSFTAEQRRLAVVRRLYNGELPEVALIAQAKYCSATRA